MKFSAILCLLFAINWIIFVTDASIINDRVATEIEADKAQIISYALVALGMAIGLVICFYGYRLFKPVLFIVGFIVGSGLTYLILYNHTQVGIIMLISVPIIAGIALGMVLIILSVVGIFVLGAVFAFLLVCIFLSTRDGGLITQKIPQYVILGVAPLIGGIIAVIFQKQLIIIATSFAGSYAVLAGIDHYIHGGFSKVIPHVIAYRTEDIDADYKTYIEIGACFLLFAVGVYVQFRHTGKNYYHKYTHESDGYYSLNNNGSNSRFRNLTI